MRERGTGGSETQDPMRQGGGCGRITTGTRESAWEWGRPAARKDGPAKEGGWVDGWMDGDGDGGTSTRRKKKAAKPPRRRARMGWDGTVGIVTD